MNTIKIDNNYWPAGVSDGLVLNCHDCRTNPIIDYHVDDDEWYRVVPDAHLSVVCLKCFMLRGGDITKLHDIQVVGDGVTVILNSTRAYRW